MLDPIRRPRVLEAAGQTLANPKTALDLGEHEHAAVQGQSPGIERHLNGFADDR